MDSSRGHNGPFGSSEEQIRKIPYATMAVQVGDDVRFLTVLATIDRGRYTWAAADRKILVTERGRIVETIGLDRDLVATRWVGADPLLDLAALESPERPQVYRHLDLRVGKHLETNVPVESELSVIGEETLTVLGEQHETLKIRERARVRKWRWTAEDTFWVDRTQPVIWRSEQTFCPEVGAMELVLFKAPEG